MISVCVCDPQPVAQRGLKALIEPRQDLRLLGMSSRLDEAVALALQRAPDVLVLDHGFGMTAVLDSLAQLDQKRRSVKTVIWGSAISDTASLRLLQAGARGVLKKTASPEAIYHCLENAAKGALWTEDLYHAADSPPPIQRNRPLTRRETEVAKLVAKGMKNREIAEALGIATGTVKIHLMHIFEKTATRHRFALALRGLRNAPERTPAPALHARARVYVNGAR